MVGKPANETAYKKQRCFAVKSKKYLFRNQITDNITNKTKNVGILCKLVSKKKSIHYQQKFTFKYDVKKIASIFN